MLRKRRLLLLAFFLMGMLYGLYKAVTQIRMYEAFGRIEVRSGSSDEYKLSTASFFGDDPQRKLSTEQAILESDTLLAKVARDLNLANNPAFNQVKTIDKRRSLDDPGRAARCACDAAGRTSRDRGAQDGHHADHVFQP